MRVRPGPGVARPYGRVLRRQGVPGRLFDIVKDEGEVGRPDACFARTPRAADLHAKVRLGQDPAGVKADARARANETFETCARQYLGWQRKKVRASTYKENERHLLKNLVPLHGLRIDATDKRSIALQLTRLAANAGPVQANRTRASLSKFLNWCLREGLVASNQAALTNTGAENKRDRVLRMTSWRKSGRRYRQTISAPSSNF